MRTGMIVIAMFGMAGGASARQQGVMGSGVSRVPTVSIPRTASLPPRDLAPAELRASYLEYRVASGDHADRSAHSRAIDEMNAINTRRPRPFRFSPVMALTFDAADMDGPARVSGIAPNLMGHRPRH